MAGTGHGASLPEAWALSAHSGSQLCSVRFPGFAHRFKLLLLGSAQPVTLDTQASAKASKALALRRDGGCVMQLFPVHLHQNKQCSDLPITNPDYSEVWPAAATGTTERSVLAHGRGDTIIFNPWLSQEVTFPPSMPHFCIPKNESCWKWVPVQSVLSFFLRSILIGFWPQLV